MLRVEGLSFGDQSVRARVYGSGFRRFRFE
jgi:hypothetical protein